MALAALEDGQADTMDRLHAIQNGRLGRLLQQLQARCARGMWPCVYVVLQVRARMRLRRWWLLTGGTRQILGMDKTHVGRIRSQLASALGDDSGRQSRVLEAAIEQLVRDKTLHRDPAPLDIDAEHGAGLGPQNVERTASRAKTVLSYVPDARMDTLQRGGVAADADLKHAGPNQRTPAVFQGDLAPVMMDGNLVGVEQVLEKAEETQAGRPMIGVGVMKDAYDYRGDVQLGIEDKTGPVKAKSLHDLASQGGRCSQDAKVTAKRENAKNEAAGAATSEVESHNLHRTKMTRRKNGSGQSFQQLNAALYHPNEDRKGCDMLQHMGLNQAGAGRFNEEQTKDNNAPLPGTAFWQCLLVTDTDASKRGSAGGNALDPGVHLHIPPTLCLSESFKGGRVYATLYTDHDGLVYLGSIKKDSVAAIEWITKMRARYIRHTNAFKAYVPLDTEPKWVMRKPKGEGQPGHDVRSILDDAGLRQALADANTAYVNLWQVYIRGPGAYAQICRVILDRAGTKTGTAHELNAHYMLSCTHEMGSKGSVAGGFFVDGNALEGSKVLGRQTLIHKVRKSSYAEHADTANRLINYAHAVFPYRKQKNGKFKQTSPKFIPDFAVVDFLVGRDGTWFFSNVLVLRSHQVKKQELPHTVAAKDARSRKFGPNVTCTLMEGNFNAVKATLAAGITRRFGPECYSGKEKAPRGQHGSLACHGSGGALQVDGSNGSLVGGSTVAEPSTLLSSKRAASPTDDQSSSQISLSLGRSLTHKELMSTEKHDRNSFASLVALSSSDEQDSTGELSAEITSLPFNSSGVQEATLPRRMPRPHSAEPLSWGLTGSFAMSNVNRLASNPRMQATGQRVLKDILVARSRAASATLTRPDNAESQIWSTLKKRVTAVALSDARSVNPANSPELLMLLGDTENVLNNQAPRARSALLQGKQMDRSLSVSKGQNPRSKSVLSESRAARQSLLPKAEIKMQVSSAAAALGHPI